MTEPKPDNPLKGKAPAPNDVRDEKTEGHTPNASFHVENDPAWEDRPGQYQAVKKGLLNQGSPGKA